MISDNATICIKTPPIFSFSECIHFLDRGYDDCLYSIDKEKVLKPLRINRSDLLIQVGENGQGLEVNILAGQATQKTRTAIENFVSQWFDLDRNLTPFYHQLKGNDQFSWMVDRFFGLRLMGIPDLFEALCWCVIGQQINLTFAHKLKRRLVEMYGSSIIYEGATHYYFPQVEVLAGLKVSDLKSLQFSRQKAEYIIGIASVFAKGELSKELVRNEETTLDMLKRLKEIRGVGDWTANYVLMKSMGQMDCITYGDTGLQSAVSIALELDRKPTRDEVKLFFEPFIGWESYLVIYLWRTLS